MILDRQKSHTALFMHNSKPVILLLFFLFLGAAGYSQFKNEDELKKQAAKYFDDEEYTNGFKLYSQLVSNYPKDPIYNFRLGVCMLFTEADKKKAIPFLKTAARTAKDDEKEALFYLGKAYHFNYQFDEAMNYYAQYKNIASASMIKKLQVDREIQACKNGKRLLSNLEELVVLDKKQLSEGDYFRSYDLKSIGGKLLVKPDEFRSAADKKKKDKSIIYLPKSNDQLYFAGYGEKSENKDIYVVKKLPSGDWSKPENLATPINTEYDEDFPFLHPNGKVLYFASKGHNSMGGFDLFKSELDPSTNRWKEPVNLAFPINSPNDDILFVTDSIEKIAFFASSRQSPAGKIDVYKILTEKRPAEFAFVTGTVLKKDASQSVLAKIKVKNVETGEDVGSFDANADGAYSLKLPNGGKFIFTVETPGFPTQSEGVNIPTAYNYMPYKQAIGYESQKLYITNFFDTKNDDENNYKEFLALIEQKSKMNVNADDFGINPENPLAAGSNQPPAVNNNQTTNNNKVPENNNQVANSANNESKNTSTANQTPNKNVSNKELVQMAYDDATELQQNADSLKADAATAFSAANSKQDQANQKKQEAAQTLAKANAETDAAKKQELNSEAEKQKDDAALYEAQSLTANNIAKQLEIDANNKQKEANLNLQYAKALEEAEKTTNNKQAIAKLEDLQKQLEAASKQKSNSNSLLESIKADADNKQQELQNAEKKQEQIANDIKDMSTEIGSLDKQIAETKDKDLIENYTAKKQEQESDLADKKKEQETNQAKINSLKEEAETLKSQADYAASIVSGSPLASNNNQTTDENKQVATNNNPPVNNQTQNNEVIATTQKENKNPTENNTTTTQESTNTTTQTTNTVTPNTEVTNNTPTTNETTNSTQTNNTGPVNDLINQAQNNFNDEKKLFGAVTYTDAKALQLKQQADEKFNGVLSDAKNIEEQLQQINNQSATAQSNNAQSQIDDLLKQADAISAQARQLRKDSKTLTGADQQNALTKIAELEKQATDLTYNAAKQQLDLDKNTFTSGDKRIDDLLLKPENKAVAEQVRQLDGEADILNKAAQELRKEAEADPSIASRIGGLSNADEKQKTALAKQQAALKLLKGGDTQSTASTGDVTQKINEFKTKLSQEIQSSNAALKTLADANKSEYTASLAKLNEAEKKNKATPEVKDLKTQAQKNMQEASVELGKASINKNEDNKRAQLLAANQKMEEALKQVKQAEQLLTGVSEPTIANNNQGTENNSQITENPSNTNSATSNTTTAITNETTNNTENRKATIEPAATNTIAPITNETGNNSTQNNTENTVTTNTIGATSNEIQNNEQKNTQAQNATNNVEPVTNNTVTPSNNNQTVSNLSPQQINEVKSSPEFKQYSLLQNELAKSTNEVTKGQNGAVLYKNMANESIKHAEQLRTDAAALPDGAEKQEKLARAEKSEKNATSLNQKADSLQEIATSTQSFVESKKQEIDAYSQKLDKNTLDNIIAVSTNTTATKTNTTNEVNNNSSTNKSAAYSEAFTTSATQYDEKLTSLQNETSTPENLNKQDEVITNYLKTIDVEILSKKKQEAAAISPSQKNKITQAIKDLQSKRKTLKQTLTANQKIVNESQVVTNNNTPSNQNPPVNNQTPNTTNNTVTPTNEGSTEAAKYIGTKGFEIKQGNAYSPTHPIPLNEKLPDGLVFRVQIGAFKSPISTDAFKGLTPIGGETTAQGFIRYQAGLFDKYNNANAVKNDLKKLGYRDAFVVAYLNGKRINLADALDTLKQKGQPVNTDATATAGITANNNVPVNVEPINNVTTEAAQPVQSSNLATVNGLLFTIQVGVYTNNVSNAQLRNLKPIFREQLTNGNYRYTAGIYSDLELVKTDRRKVNALGIGDAFVSAYLNGQRIKITDAIDKVSADKTIQFPPQQPIIFSGEAVAPQQPANNNPQPANTNPQVENTTTGIQPFSNGITEGPAPTADNGVKANDDGITFKVQIGAYSKQVPQQIADTWLKLKTWPIKYIVVNNLYLYTVGSFTEARFAEKLRAEVLALGMNGAFITVFKDGKKLSATEAQTYLTR